MSTFQSNISSLLRATGTTSAKPNQQVSLRSGQVLLGKVTQLFPNQTATIEVNNQQIVAKLQTPLDVGAHYLFKVQEMGELPQLKVMIETSTQQSIDEQIINLLKQLELPVTRENSQFLRELMEKEIPFRPTDLKQAIGLIQEKSGSKEQLFELIEKQLPITINSVKAVHHQKNTPLHTQLEQILLALDQAGVSSEAETKLQNRVTSLVDNHSNKLSSEEITASLIKQIHAGDEELISLLKMAGVIKKEVNATNTEEIIEQLGRHITHSNNHASSSPKHVEIFEKLIELFQKQLPISEQESYQLQKFSKNALETTDNGSNQSLQSLHNMLQNSVFHSKVEQYLPEQTKPLFMNWKNNQTPENLTPLLSDLVELSDQQAPKPMQIKLIHLLTQFQQTKEIELPLKDQFLLKTKQFLHFSGIDYEHRILHEQINQMEHEQSLKQSVLETLQAGTAHRSELETLLLTINGLQLASVQEDNNFMQVTMQLPAMFGAKDNIQLEFHSKKAKDEQVDSDYCRIAFYLDLETIGATMIDMTVQKRMVNLTIYNEDENIVPLLMKIKPMLQAGLAKNDYHLSNVRYQPFPEKQEHQKIRQPHPNQNYRGVDIRI
ncbi:hypothetical protein J2T56_000515 [Natronobacillus azotifigens]|uniref:Flagellar hook-length control protein-like C-terminal domain-containing protein n=1 Tax=Natronobacillus azotifigens TaxID=472978 RepID=A0A9J6RDI5_9BACI|nr:hypothetical protein [Natronobacillus azotifigens]MCZ0703411.1 hypothetical protein [Natronobacillus azotifigens]